MIARAEKKLYLDRMVTHDCAGPPMEEEDGVENLLKTLRFGCNAIFGSNEKVQKLPTNEDIELITDRSRTENTTIGKLKGGADLSADTFDEMKEMVSTTSFGGIDFQELRRQHEKKGLKSMGDINELWRKRQRKNRIKMVDGMGSGYVSLGSQEEIFAFV